MVLTHAGQNIQGGGHHASGGFRTIRVPDCLWRIGIGNRYYFDVAAVSSSRNRVLVVPLLADPRMLSGILDSKFCVVQRNSNHNTCPRSNRMDPLCRSRHLVLEEAIGVLRHASRPWHFGQKYVARFDGARHIDRMAVPHFSQHCPCR